ncbi:unnamed protein product [Didymodactylos carnosus]|nr:unnamed protein product [Didymodactylos carnosus]CAF4373891.1 unnamed protein product [Didymodactylos carnosus]
MSKASQVKKFAYAVQRVAEMRKDPMFTVAQLKQIASDAKINIEKFDDIITKLNDNGYLLKKGLGTYKFQIID